MQFRLELDVKPLPALIKLGDPILLVGSCFSEHMSTRLQKMRFPVLENPNGILFNPISIQQAVSRWADNQPYLPHHLFFDHEMWHSWDFHGKFSNPDQTTVLNKMNTSIEQAHHFLSKAQWAIITLGSSFLYRLRKPWVDYPADYVVANCHKLPANYYRHELGSFDQIITSLHKMIAEMRRVQPTLQILFTVSPVRHYREGLVENNRSKGLLHVALHEILHQYKQVYYFPSYELVIDDLRDYRFYAEDLVHPNYAATRYVWEKFVGACFDEPTQQYLGEMEKLNTAIQHRPIHPESLMHQQFKQSMLEKVKQLQQKYPSVNFEDAINWFSN